ncbi:hypothetical protein N7497_011080 [Penicillium chrysogenum]|nr:hypothetical protein N7524_011160 [Penicillium chrysogenum]KAJ6141981.1 hypothetical protein N7497_011080 [Penicillium chrysogenum]
MSSYLTSLTTSSAISGLGSRLTNLRRAITLGDEGDDPDNEDCSHISNALRAYYTEKGRPFPPWLPQDPKGPAPAQSRPIATSQLPSGSYSQGPPANSGRSGGLGDLWGDSPTSQHSVPQTASLRRGRGGAAPPLTSANSAPPAATFSQSRSPAGSGSSSPSGARPLPSQRAGSHQSSQSRPNLDRAGSGGGSAQERLRARLQGEGLLVPMLTLVFESLLECLEDGEIVKTVHCMVESMALGRYFMSNVYRVHRS